MRPGLAGHCLWQLGNGPALIVKMRDLRLTAPQWRLSGGSAFLLLVLGAVTVLLNPRRELLTWDDGWAYARSVATMVQTGRYVLDNWAAANTPVQIALAAFECKIFGYSPSC